MRFKFARDSTKFHSRELQVGPLIRLLRRDLILGAKEGPGCEIMIEQSEQILPSGPVKWDWK